MNFNLPPGFRFCPTDEELVIHFLHRKSKVLPCNPDVIPDLDLYPYDPWDLNGKAMGEGKKWYFYSRRTQSRRITESGYWDFVGGNDEPIYSSDGHKIGVKKCWEFYIGETNSKAVKTNWAMQEYRLSDSCSSRSRRNSKSSDLSKWTICRVYEGDCDSEDDDGTELSCLDEVFLSLDDLDEGLSWAYGAQYPLWAFLLGLNWDWDDTS